jgi:O-antigen/teichoic acid export membrane protein
LLFRGVTVRGLTYAAIALLLFVFAGPICRAFEFDPWVDVVRWYCLVGFLRVNGTFISNALESLLWQREAQYSSAISGLLKLLLVIGAVWRGGMNLVDFVAIEIVSELVLLLVVLGWAIVRWKSDPERDIGDPAVLHRERARYRRFGLWSYAQNLTSIGFGSAPNRLLVSYFLPINALASFGVIDRFVDFVRRYEPLRMFVGMVRPVLNSRFDGGKGFERIVSAANMLFRANLAVLIGPFVIFAVGGNTLFAWLTGGKYDELTLLFLGFYAVAILNSVDSIMDIIVKLLEENKIYSASNIVRSCAIGLAIPMIHRLGLWSLVIANTLSLLISFAIIFVHLRARGHCIRVDWLLIARIIAYAACAIGLGHVIILMQAPPVLAAVASGAIFVLAIWARPR